LVINKLVSSILYWIPTECLTERVQQDEIPYDKWYERGLIRLCTGKAINYSDITTEFCKVLQNTNYYRRGYIITSILQGIL